MEITNAFSTSNGIMLRSAIDPHLFLYTYINDNGEIISEQLTEEAANQVSFKLNSHLMIFVWIVLCVFAIVFSIKYAHVFCGLYFIFTISWRLTCILYLFIFGKQKRNHAVEHMIINCYNNHMDLTKNNIKKCSRFHYNCGFQKTFYLILSRLIVLVIIWKSSTKYWILCILIYFFLPSLLNFLNKIPIFLYIQVLATKRPTDYELNLGIVAINNFKNMEQSLK